MSDDLRLNEPGELAAHLADGGDVDDGCDVCGQPGIVGWHYAHGLLWLCAECARDYGLPAAPPHLTAQEGGQA